MDRFDAAIIEFLNGFSRKSETFDLALRMLADSDWFKGGVLVTMLALLFYLSPGRGDAAERRRSVLASFAGSYAALFAARAMALALPFRDRPKFNPGLHFVPPYSITDDYLRGWSSFPSDHATLFVALAVGILLVSRPLGIAASAYVLLVILFPRVYLGLHYPTDLIAGALLGALLVLAANRERVRNAVADPVLAWAEKHPALFNALFVLSCYETARLFAHVRRFGKQILRVSEMVADKLF